MFLEKFSASLKVLELRQNPRRNMTVSYRTAHFTRDYAASLTAAGGCSPGEVRYREICDSSSLSACQTAGTTERDNQDSELK